MKKKNFEVMIIYIVNVKKLSIKSVDESLRASFQGNKRVLGWRQKSSQMLKQISFVYNILRMDLEDIVQKLNNFDGYKHRLLNRLQNLFDANPQIAENAYEFNFPGESSITLPDYLDRLGQFMHCSGSIFVQTYLLFKRLQNQGNRITENTKTVQALFGVLMTIAIKTHEDQYYQNSYYAQVVGLPLESFNELESNLASALKFKFAIETDEFLVVAEEMLEED